MVMDYGSGNDSSLSRDQNHQMEDGLDDLYSGV